MALESSVMASTMLPPAVHNPPAMNNSPAVTIFFFTAFVFFPFFFLFFPLLKKFMVAGLAGRRVVTGGCRAVLELSSLLTCEDQTGLGNILESCNFPLSTKLVINYFNIIKSLIEISLNNIEVVAFRYY